MTSLSESNLFARYIDHDLDALEQLAQSFLNQCKHLRRVLETGGLQLLRLQQTILSGIAAMEGVKNMTRPINRIPAEVMVDIFVLLPRSLPVLDGAPSVGKHWPFAIPDQRRYLELASVCRRWRDIIFNTPSFLSVVSESFPRAHTKIPDMWQVDRCPCSPLTVHVRGIVSRRMWKLLNRAEPRVQQLHLNNLDPAQGEAMRELLRSFPASNLEHCKLHIPVPPRIREPVRSVFSGGAGRLRSLYLDRPSFLLSDAFPELTYLTITLLNVSGEVHWSMGDLCRFLSGSPLLEELYLDLSYLTRSFPTHHSPHLNLSRLRAFTFHLFNIRGAATTSEVLQAFLPLVGLSPSCRRVDLGPIDIGDLEILAPYILSLAQPRTRMRLSLHVRAPAPFHGTHGQSYKVQDSALVFASSAQPDLAGGIPRKLPPVTPLLADVEEVWVKTHALSAPLLRSVLLPPKARSLALTVLDEQLQVHHLAPLVDDVHPQLDTLCIVTSGEHARAVQDRLVPMLRAFESVAGSLPWPNGGGGGPSVSEGHRIRRLALGYVSRSTASGGSATRWHAGAGAEFRWVIGLADAVDPAQDGSEMQHLLRAVPELLKPPVTVRSGWPVF